MKIKTTIKYFCFIILLFFSSFCFSQSKIETEKWILEKCNLYAINNTIPRNFKIENGYFTYYEYVGETWFYARILIKNVAKIKIIKEESSDWGYTIKFYCNGKGCNDYGHFVNGIYKNTIIEYIGNEFDFDVYLNKKFGKDHLSKRMEKALIHLIKLYGGNAKIFKEVF